MLVVKIDLEIIVNKIQLFKDEGKETTPFDFMEISFTLYESCAITLI